MINKTIYTSKEYENYIHIYPQNNPINTKRVIDITVISDLHEKHQDVYLPPGDLLLITGDMTNEGTYKEMDLLLDYLNEHSYKFRQIIAIAGNHDLTFHEEYYKNNYKRFNHDPPCDPKKIKKYFDPNNKMFYLEDSKHQYEDLKIWGTPWITYWDEWAFSSKDETYLETKFSKIPDQVDILMSHSPPFGVLDLFPETTKNNNKELVNIGSRSLKKRVDQVKPKLHVFGHAHYSAGWEERNGTLFVNAACLTVDSKNFNKTKKVTLFL